MNISEGEKDRNLVEKYILCNWNQLMSAQTELAFGFKQQTLYDTKTRM